MPPGLVRVAIAALGAAALAAGVIAALNGAFAGIVIAVGGNINGRNQAQFMAFRVPNENAAPKGKGGPPPDPNQ